MSKNNTLCIAEWQTFGVEDIQEVIADTRKDKAKDIFNEFVEFTKQEGNDKFLKFKNSTTLKAQNYVGLIQTKSGFCLEILPKTFRTAKDSEGFAIKNCVCSSQKSIHPLIPSAGEGEQEKCQVCQAKQILLNMLRTLRSSPYKQSHISNLKIHRFPLLEVFAIMFLDEVERLIKRGIKSDYVVREENRTFLKGKLLFDENLKYNFAHKERFFTANDEFIADIAPNRLLVSTILFLSAQVFSPRTSGRISQARFIFADIGPSKSIDKDFALCPSSRHYKDYELLLAWCEIFLRRKSFMPYQGGDKAFALLFDMNKLFESFVAWHLKRVCKNHIVKSQDGHKFLIKDDKFRIKPDLVIYGKDETDLKSAKTKCIADTKWKILNFSRDDYGIAQGDLYQMFAYLAKYQCAKGYLIYPKIAGNESINHNSFTYKAKVCFYDEPKENPPPHKKQEMKLQIYFFNLHNPSEAANEILLNLC